MLFYVLFVTVLHIVSTDSTMDLMKQETLFINESQTKFTSGFHQGVIELTANKTNVVVSPLSVYLLLAMLRVGAVKRSNTQITEAMALPDDLHVDYSLRKFADSLFSDNETMNLYNKIWQQTYFCFTRCRQFTKKVREIFNADLGEVNFFVNPKETVDVINRWAFVKSGGRIDKLVSFGEITRSTRFVLTNMIYFKANWEQIFFEKYTGKRRFTVLENGEPKNKLVDMMFTHADYKYTFGFENGYSLIELPYENQDFSMIIILPNAIDDFNKIEKSLNFTELNALMKRLEGRPKSPVTLFMPKFCISIGMNLNDVLKKMGVTDIFDPFLADLSNVTGFKGMYVSNVHHEVFIKVTEHGTEAAGGSSITSGDLSFTDDFRVNKPFLFLIRHVPTQSIVFLGRVKDPSVKENKCNQ